MFRAICIKKCEDFRKGEIVKAWQGFGTGVHFYKGFKFSINMSQKKFTEHFMPFKSYYIIEKPPIKRRFRKPKPSFARIEFKEIPDHLLVELYNHIFSYLELTKQMSPELIQTFNYSVVSTLEKLEFLYTVLPEYKFEEAIQDASKVFEGIYKTALSIELDLLPKEEDYQQLYENFKNENEILKNFFDTLNKKS